MIMLAIVAAVGTAKPLMPPDFAGVAVVVDAATGRTLQGGAFGMVAPGGTERFDLRRRWRLASFTKQVMATLVMQSVEAGRLDLDAPVSQWLPAFADRPVTVRQLLTHRSGLASPEADDDVADAYYARDEAGQRTFCAGPERAAAGAPFFYNNCDFVTVAAVLEKVEGKPWTRLLRDRINRRAGTRFTLDRRGAPMGYIADRPDARLDAVAYGAAGGLHGTLGDVIAFDRALLDGRLLGRKARDILWAGDPASGYSALGQWSFTAPLAGCAGAVPIVERRGQIGGVQLRNFILPAQNRIVVAFTNRSEFEWGELWQGRGNGHALASAACL